MTGTPHSHVAFLVENLEAAMARFSEVLGVTFNEPRTIYFDHLHDPEKRQTSIRATFSKEGPPHYELIEGDGQSPVVVAAMVRVLDLDAVEAAAR